MIIERLQRFFKNPLRIAVLVGRSYSGKTTIAKALRACDPTLQWLLSTTTRQPRTGEPNANCEYVFVSPEEFAKLRTQGAFAWETSPQGFGDQYATQIIHKERALAGPHISLAILRPQEAKLLKLAHPENVELYYVYASQDILEKRGRLQRGEDSRYIQKRLEESAQWDTMALLMHADKLIARIVKNEDDPLLAFEEIYGSLMARSGKLFVP